MRQGPMILQPMQDGMIDIDNNSGNIDIDFAQSQDTNGAMGGAMAQAAPGVSTTMAPIIEPARERVVNRTIEHVVPHVCPIHTRVINHHVYRHTYQPRYTCSEENTVSNVQCGSCCNFR